MNSNAYCQQKGSPPGSDRYYALLRAPARQRAAACALYALCQEIAEVALECHDPGVARTKLDWWRTELARLDAGQPEHPASRALAPALAASGITTTMLGEVIDGAQMDIEQMRYLDQPGLRRYCDLSGGAPAELAARIYGVSGDGGAATLRHARALGQALAMARVVADVGADARRGYVYLPIDVLQRFGVTAADLQNGRYSENFSALMKHEVGQVREQLAQARALLPRADRRRQRAGLVMARLNEVLLDEIERSDFQVLHQRIALTPLRKLWVAWRTH